MIDFPRYSAFGSGVSRSVACYRGNQPLALGRRLQFVRSAAMYFGTILAVVWQGIRPILRLNLASKVRIGLHLSIILAYGIQQSRT